MSVRVDGAHEGARECGCERDSDGGDALLQAHAKVAHERDCACGCAAVRFQLSYAFT